MGEDEQRVRLSPQSLDTFETYSEEILNQAVIAFWERFTTQIGIIKRNNEVLSTRNLLMTVLESFNSEKFHDSVLRTLLNIQTYDRTSLYSQDAVEMSQELIASLLAKTLYGFLENSSIIERAGENASNFALQMKTKDQVNQYVLKATSELARDNNKLYNLILKHH